MTKLFAFCALLVTAAAAQLPAQSADPNAKFTEGRKHILFLGAQRYYAHDAVSKAMYTMAKLGEESGLFDVMFRTDFKLVTKQDNPQLINAKNLNYFDAVMFFTQGDFPLTEQQRADLLSFVREDGKGLLVAHSGTDHNRWKFSGPRNMSIENQGGWPEFTEMIGGVFINHPWLQKVKIDVEDRAFPATEHFPPSFEIEEEIYQIVKFSRDDVRVLMTLDVDTVDLKTRRWDRSSAWIWISRWRGRGNGERGACLSARWVTSLGLGSGRISKRCGSRRRAGCWG